MPHRQLLEMLHYQRLSDPSPAHGQPSLPPKPVVEVASVATALPRHALSQETMLARVRDIFPHLSHLEPVFANTGIEQRHMCMPLDWYIADHGWPIRAEVYAREATALIEQAAKEALASAGLEAGDIDAIVTASTTGLCVPSLDARLMNRMGFRADTQRLPLFGLGCAAGVSGLARCCQIAHSLGQCNVLLLAVELCSLNFRLSDPSKAMFISSALFGDGAAALVLRGREPEALSHQKTAAPPRIIATGEHLWTKSEDLMGWSVEDDGFGVVISTRIPSFARSELAEAASAFLAKHELELRDLDGFILHPGGRKVLEAMSSVFGIEGDELRHSWDVLRDCGNMSSPTVLFVLQRAIQSGAKGLHLMAALGPGFTIAFALVEL